MGNEYCETCKHCHADKCNGLFFCHRYPPTLVVEVLNRSSNVKQVRPAVYSYDSCGEYEKDERVGV